MGADHNLPHLLTASLCAEEPTGDLGDLGSRKSRAASVPGIPAPKELLFLHPQNLKPFRVSRQSKIYLSPR